MLQLARAGAGDGSIPLQYLLSNLPLSLLRYLVFHVSLEKESK